VYFVTVIEILEHFDFLSERVDWETGLLSETVVGLYLLSGITGVITCKLLRRNKQGRQTNKKNPKHQTIMQDESVKLIEVFCFTWH